jgi:hypothetical protein
MQITLEPTGEVLVTAENLPVRIWQGKTAVGTRIVALILAIAPKGDSLTELVQEMNGLREAPLVRARSRP